jgi:hypothetical protein
LGRLRFHEPLSLPSFQAKSRKSRDRTQSKFADSFDSASLGMKWVIIVRRFSAKVVDLLLRR